MYTKPPMGSIKASNDLFFLEILVRLGASLKE